MAITKNEIDDFFNRNYKTFEIFLKRKIKSKSNNVEPSTYIAEAYINILERKDEIDYSRNLEKVIHKFFYNNLNWYGNNSINGDNKININSSDDYEYITDIVFSDKEKKADEELETYVMRISALELYHQSCNPFDREVFEHFFYKKQCSVRKLKASLNIKHTKAQKAINKMKAEIIKKYDELKNY